MGIVPIGGICREPQAMIELLQLPELTLPVRAGCQAILTHPLLKNRACRWSVFVMKSAKTPAYCQK
ncbi:hypothetical protein BN440_2553 [Erwinia amylovora MR1]|nr:hypothetical protein BN440_2553 [Erwinia amylovora MR1]